MAAVRKQGQFHNWVSEQDLSVGLERAQTIIGKEVAVTHFSLERRMYGCLVGDLFVCVLRENYRVSFCFSYFPWFPITSEVSIWGGCSFPIGEQHGLVVSVRPASNIRGCLLISFSPF